MSVSFLCSAGALKRKKLRAFCLKLAALFLISLFLLRSRERPREPICCVMSAEMRADFLNRTEKAPLDCEAMFRGEKLDAGAKWKPKAELSNFEMLENFRKLGCSWLPNYFNLAPCAVSEEEKAFPLAFVVIGARSPIQTLRLIELMYQPQNLFCLTYDLKSSGEFGEIMKYFAGCFPNILMPAQHISIAWGHFSIMEATLNCLRVLDDAAESWKYVQILSYNDLPLRTNREMVEIFRILNGSNDAELVRGQPERFRVSHRAEETGKNYDHHPGFEALRMVANNSAPKPIPPGNIVIYKGSFASLLTRQATRFMFRSEIVEDFIRWSEDTVISDEFLLSSLIHNPQIGMPGSFPGSCLQFYGNQRKSHIARFQVWYNEGTCHSRNTVHASCVFGVADLKQLREAHQLVAHKFYHDFQPATLSCVRDWYRKRTFERWMEMDHQTYRTLPHVRYHNTKDKGSFVCDPPTFQRNRTQIIRL